MSSLYAEFRRLVQSPIKKPSPYAEDKPSVRSSAQSNPVFNAETCTANTEDYHPIVLEEFERTIQSAEKVPTEVLLSELVVRFKRKRERCKDAAALSYQRQKPSLRSRGIPPLIPMERRLDSTYSLAADGEDVLGTEAD